LSWGIFWSFLGTSSEPRNPPAFVLRTVFVPGDCKQVVLGKIVVLRNAGNSKQVVVGKIVVVRNNTIRQFASPAQVHVCDLHAWHFAPSHSPKSPLSHPTPAPPHEQAHWETAKEEVADKLHATTMQKLQHDTGRQLRQTTMEKFTARGQRIGTPQEKDNNERPRKQPRHCHEEASAAAAAAASAAAASSRAKAALTSIAQKENVQPTSLTVSKIATPAIPATDPLVAAAAPVAVAPSAVLALPSSNSSPASIPNPAASQVHSAAPRSAMGKALETALRSAGIDPSDSRVSNCFKSAVSEGRISLTSPASLDALLHTGTCIICSKLGPVQVRSVVRQADSGETSYMDGDDEAGRKSSGRRAPPVRCEGCGYHMFLTGLCCGKMQLESGKSHKHCNKCPGLGKCVWDIRNEHCWKCGEHYFAGFIYGGSCPDCSDDRSDSGWDEED
jgi:hypothetical protein